MTEEEAIRICAESLYKKNKREMRMLIRSIEEEVFLSVEHLYCRITKEEISFVWFKHGYRLVCEGRRKSKTTQFNRTDQSLMYSVGRKKKSITILYNIFVFHDQDRA